MMCYVWWGPAVSASWNDLGIALDVSFNVRQGLQTSNLDNDWKLETVLQKWHSNQASEVTWETILKVLVECEQCNIAREVQEYLEEPEVYKKYILKKDLFFLLNNCYLSFYNFNYFSIKVGVVNSPLLTWRSLPEAYEWRS